MISRVVVPTDARISGNPPKVLSKAHVVPRRLIPADAELSATPAVPAPYQAREMMVPGLLVPAVALTGSALKSCWPDGPRGSACQRLFDEALLGKAALGHKRSATEWLISIGVHAVIVAAAIILPLFLTHAIDPYKLELTYLVAPPLAATLPPPPIASATRRLIPKPAASQPAKLTMPTPLPRNIPKIVENEIAEVSPEVAGIPGDFTGGTPEGQIGGLLGGAFGGTDVSPSRPQPVAAASAPSEPLHLGGNVRKPREIYKPAPQYPLLARQGMIEGVVTIDAIVDKYGNVVGGRAMSGPALLIGAALDAVKLWKYEPTYLNGVPWPIELTISVTFSLS